ncbi:MAG: hypothetical protein LUG55_05040 [Clostridiales bacterium]|nr:hypothetical protein [Clostridiales bacterium]
MKKESNVIHKRRAEFLSALARGLLDLIESCMALFGRGQKGQMEQQLERKQRGGAHLTIWLAGIFLTVMTLLAFCIPLRPTYSELEQRNLATFPTPTVSTVLNGAFFTDVSSWFSDTFPLRERFMKLNNAMQSGFGIQSTQIHGTVQQGDEIPTVPDGSSSGNGSSGATAAEAQSSTVQPEQSDVSSATEPEQSDTSSAAEPEQTADSSQAAPEQQPDSSAQPEEEESVAIPELDPDAKVETLGALLVIDDAAYEYYNFSTDRAKEYLSGINRAAEQLDGVANVYSMIVPSSMDICVPESVRSGINTSDQAKAIDYFYSSMDDAVTTVNVFDTLLTHSAEGEYVYYRTDHHWTALGAYYAYCEFASAAGRPVADLEGDFEEHVFGGYLGSFYRETNSSAMKANPDTVYAYEPVDTNTITIHWKDGTVWDYNIITDVTDWAATSKYASAFIGGDNPYSVIENPNITDGSSILLVKESYGNCFAPFLVESYQYVYVVDYRYYNDTESGTLLDLVKEQNIQDVLFLNTISTTRAENLIAELQQFIG